MAYAALKVLVTALLVVAISEAAKRSSMLGGVVASLPVVSLLAIVWIYGETGDTNRIADLSLSIFWYVLPSLVLFLMLPLLLRHGLGFWTSLIVASAATFAAYLALTAALSRFGVRL